MINMESIAINVLKCALAWEPDVCLLGNITAAEIATLAASKLTACPKCGAEPYVNIDCDLCSLCSSLLESKTPE